jgi:hypothetical protein
MSNETSYKEDVIYERLWNEWSDSVKLPIFKFFSGFGVCEEKVNSLLLEFGYDDKESLNKEEFYKLMRKVEFAEKCKTGEFGKMSIFSSFQVSQSQHPNEFVFH